MTLAKSERITGCIILPIHPTHYPVGYAAYDGADQIAAAAGKNTAKALELLVKKVYDFYGARQAKVQRYRCAFCGRLLPTERHHVVSRSQGRRNDREIVCLCRQCHESIHRRSRAMSGVRYGNLHD